MLPIFQYSVCYSLCPNNNLSILQLLAAILGWSFSIVICRSACEGGNLILMFITHSSYSCHLDNIVSSLPGHPWPFFLDPNLVPVLCTLLCSSSRQTLTQVCILIHHLHLHHLAHHYRLHVHHVLVQDLSVSYRGFHVKS